MFKLTNLIATLIISVSAITAQHPLYKCRWTEIEAHGECKARHEAAFVEHKGKFYLIGGRGINPVNVFDPKTNTWEAKSSPPTDIHHFQAVSYGDAIYLMGAMSGKYPVETPLEHVWKYVPATDSWEKSHEIPENRRRGGAGAAVYMNKIYLACGIEFGHTSGTNNYFDAYDPETGEWEILTKAPHIRDHFPAIVVGDKLYCVGGRNTSFHTPERFGAFFDAVEPHVDVYDFNKGKWVTLKEKLPYPTAAGGLVEIDNKIIYMGGEGPLKMAYNQTQCFDIETRVWTQLAPMVTGRHGTGAIAYNNNIYIAAGSPKKGGGNLNSIEVFSIDHNWVSLFNGENLDGWEVKCMPQDKDKELWFVENGAIVCNTKGKRDHSYVWLQTEKEFSDFELRLKFQASRENKGNSGVQFRSRYDATAKVDEKFDEPGWLDGPQVDIDPQNPWRNGFIYDETRTNRRWVYPDLESWKISKEEHAPKRVVYYWEDQGPKWNDMRIVCKGMKITTYVNNLKVANYDGSGVLDSKGHKKYNVDKQGHIALQLHKGAMNYIRFKDIEIREF